MKEFYDEIKKAFDLTDIKASREQMEQCAEYAHLLVEKNKIMNLTGITEAKEVAIKHFCDSLMLLKYYKIPSGASIIDIGTGAGFPGLPIGIIRPDIKVTLLDSLEKRCHFLREVVDALGLTNVDVTWDRAEDGARKEGFRETFDFATARAVASLPVLIEYALPYLKVGGVFLPLKGKAEEVPYDNALKELSAVLEKEHCFELTLVNEERRIYEIVKTGSTIDKYPRRAGKVTKKPL